MGDFMTFHSQQPLDAPIDPERAIEEDHARAAGASRLQSLGVRLTGTESTEEIGTMIDAVDEWEAAVEMAGGDLMVDEAPNGRTTEPDDPAFVLPRRKDGEPVAQFAQRVRTAARELRRPRGQG